MGEFEQSIQLTRDAPWGQRVGRLKQSLAVRGRAMRLREIDEAAGMALPIQKVRYSGRLVSTAPKLDEPPDEAAIGWAMALLTFADEIRTCATEGGFGGLRGKVLETLGKRIDQYVEDLLEQLRLGDVQDEARACEFPSTSPPGLLGVARDKKSGDIIRRRAAAA